MRSRLAPVALAVLALSPFTAGLAQEQALPLEPGTRVRVTAPALGLDKQAATFETVIGDTLVLSVDSTTFFPLASVARLDVYRGRKSHSGRGAMIGALPGAVIGGVVAHELCTDEWMAADKAAECALLGGVIGAGVGMGVGAIVGSLIKTDRWVEVPLDRFRVSIVPQHDGLALGVSVAF